MKRRERKHKFKNKKINFFIKINIFKYLSILLIVLFTLSIPTVIKKLIKINKIECNSQFGLCTKDYQLGDYSFVKNQIQDDLNKNIAVSSYLIQYKIPSTVKIDLVLKKPKYAIKDANNRYYLLDVSGNVLEITNETDLPSLIKNEVSYEVGKVILETDKKALEIFEKTSFVLTTISGTIENETLKVVLDRGILVYFPLDGDVDVLVGSLRLIFSRLNDSSEGIRMEDVREIDLRFKNPVIR